MKIVKSPCRVATLFKHVLIKDIVQMCEEEMNMVNKTNFLESELSSLDEQGLMRRLVSYSSCGGKFEYEGREILNLSSNDYLNLSKHSSVQEGSHKALEKYGCSATASRLVSGHLSIHEELEAGLAELLGCEDCLVFGSGFLANIGVLNALAGRGDEVYMDRLNHASLIDGALLSGAQLFRYKHKDTNHLESLLKKSKGRGRKIIVSDSLFSMDGDIAPVQDLAVLSKKNRAIFVVDEAHAIGVFGRGGGICQELDVKPDIILGTLSKAFGGYGGFAACSIIMRKFLINRARSFIYSTGLPPACIGSARAGLQLINDNRDMGKALLRKSRKFHSCLSKAGFKMPKFESQIIPLNIGDNRKVVDISNKLFKEHNILAAAIRPPTVPRGTARLRLSVSLAHSDNDLKNAVDKIAKAVKLIGLNQDSS
jgi:8-amino-7-oxononanoate synthase